MASISRPKSGRRLRRGGRAEMSRRLRLNVALMRWFVKPLLRRTGTPEKAARDFEVLARWMFRPPPLTCHVVQMAGPLRLHRISIGPTAPRRVVLYLHGGAFLSGSGRSHSGLMARLSLLSGVEFCAPDYRLLQDAPFPAAFDDAVTAWHALMDLGYAPQDVVLGGDSAGGGLALALMAHLTAMGQRPAAAFAFSPWTDLTLQGESIARLGPADPIIPVERMAEVVGLYLAGADPRDPRASPLFAALSDPPPVFLQVGSTEALLSDSTRFADHLRAAGGQVDLQIWPAAPHVWQILDGWVPEARAALTEVAGFIQTSFAKASR